MRRRATRAGEGLFVAEGAKLIGEALDAGLAVDEVFVADGAVLSSAESAAVDRAAAGGADVLAVEDRRLRQVLDTVTPQPVAAVVHRRAPDGDILACADLVLVLAGVSDPGNAGTLVRTAVAAGAQAVVATTGTVDLWSPKCVRASAGTVVRPAVVEAGDLDAALADLGRAGITTIGTTLGEAASYDSVDLRGPTAVVLGNEAHGLDRTGVDLGRWVTIPMAGPAESLNVAAAGAVLCFEVLRQRRAAGGRAGGGTDWTGAADGRKG